MESKPPIYLALSGGGTRAMAFHTGVLKFLAEKESLERVEEISSVSGGTLLTGLILRINDYKWPDSKQFLDHVLPALCEKLSDKDFEKKLVSKWFHDLRLPWEKTQSHWLAEGLRKYWGINSTWGDIPKSPRWVVNTTSAETGKRFYFSGKWLSCYEIGKTNAENLPLAEIMAASAAVPGVIGPWVLKVEKEKWTKARKNTLENEVLLNRYESLHLYDGGLYDNLGLEQFVNVGEGFKKAYKNGVVIVSDAGRPLKKSFDRSRFNPRRMEELLDIPLDQTRALRVRDFQSHLRADPGCGVHIRIGVTKTELVARADSTDKEWLTKRNLLEKDENVRTVAKTDTRLHGFDPKLLELIIRNGYELAMAGARKEKLRGIYG